MPVVLAAPSFIETLSVKERVVENRRQTLEAVRIVNGFSMDNNLSLRYRAAGWQLETLPATIIVGKKERRTPLVGAPFRYAVELTGEIQAYLTNEPIEDTESKMNEFLKNLEAALQQDVGCGVWGASLTANARDFEITDTEVDPAEAERPWTVGVLSFLVKYQVSRSDPTRAY